MKVIISTDWNEFATIKKWKKGLAYNSHKNRLSKSTEDTIKTAMPLFMEYSQKNPDELIEEALHSKDTVRERLFDFCNWLQDVKGKKLNNSINLTYSLIRGFYSNNDINTQKIRTPKKEPTQVQFSDDNVPVFDIVEKLENGVIVENKVIRRDFLKEFIGYLNPRDQIIAVCLLSSGLDSGDILGLTIASIKYQDPKQKRIFIRDLRNKTGESINTFFSVEATKLIRHYISTQRKNALDSEPIFSIGTKESKSSFHKRHRRKFDPSRDQLISLPIVRSALSKNFRDAIMRFNEENQDNQIMFQNDKQSPLRPKRFRKIFNDVCDASGIPTDIKRVFMGKKDTANKPYEGKSRQDLEIYYKKIENNLTILSEPRPPESHEILKLKEQMLIEKSENERDMMELKRIIEKLDARIKKQESVG